MAQKGRAELDLRERRFNQDIHKSRSYKELTNSEKENNYKREMGRIEMNMRSHDNRTRNRIGEGKMTLQVADAEIRYLTAKQSLQGESSLGGARRALDSKPWKSNMDLGGRRIEYLE